MVDTMESNWRQISPFIKNKTAYKIDEYDQSLNLDYWQRLAPKAVMYGAGVIKLFLEQTAEYQPILQKAQIFTPSPELLPESEPVAVRLPVIETIKPLSKPFSQTPSQPFEPPLIEESEAEGEQPAASPEGKQAGKGENKGENKGEEQGEEQGFSFSGSPSGSPSTSPQEPEQPEQPAQPPHLVINEIQIRDNEFVELYNPTDTGISLASYSFCYYSSNRDWNDPWRNQQFPATASISAGGYYLIGLEGYPKQDGNPNADWQVYNSNQLSNIAGSVAILLWDPTGKTASESQAGAIDTVAWGNMDFVKEGTSFQGIIGQDKSIQRKNNGQDTNDNNADFELKKIPTPTNSHNEQRIPGTLIDDHTIISEDTIWTIANSPYYIESNASQWPIVNPGVILTIEPGVVIMPQNPSYTFLEIRGTLKAEGAPDEKIVITSKNDSDYGGSSGAQPGDWTNIIFTPTSVNSSFKNVIFRYGGKKYGLNQVYTEAIKVDSSSIEMENVIIEKSESRGLYLINSNSKIKTSIFKDSKIGILIEGASDTSTIEDSFFENNEELGIEIKNSASPVIENNQFTNNGTVVGTSDQGAIMVYSAYPEFSNNQASNNINNGILVHWKSRFSRDTIWKADLPYVLISNAGEYPTIASGSTLTLEPRIVLKPMSGYYTALLVEGTLIAEAASNSEIVFTSLKDDSWGGDTNNDGNTSMPANNDWKEIKFISGSSGVLDHVFLYYGSMSPIATEEGASVKLGEVDFAP
jgi:parallel beta-helix repeat protein